MKVNIFSGLMTILTSFLKYLFMSFVIFFLCGRLYIHKNINRRLYLLAMIFKNQFSFSFSEI